MSERIPDDASDTAHPPTSSPEGPVTTFESPANEDVDSLSYEAARDELAAIVARLESGQVNLDESMALWQRGDALAARCTILLDAAEHALDDGRSPEGPPTGR